MEDDMPRRVCGCPVRSNFDHDPGCPQIRAAQEISREWITLELLDEAGRGTLPMAIGRWLSRTELVEGSLQPRRVLNQSIDQVAVLIEVLVGAVANTYDSPEDFSAHVIEALLEADDD
jgi:hypothetical protein